MIFGSHDTRFLSLGFGDFTQQEVVVRGKCAAIAVIAYMDGEGVQALAGMGQCLFDKEGGTLPMWAVLMVQCDAGFTQKADFMEGMDREIEAGQPVVEM